jgi:DNA-binding transcriptional ArsR family regulator
VEEWYDPGVSATSAVPHPLPEPLVDLLAQRFRVLSEPMRIKLLDSLREGGASVGELQAALGASQQNLSKHLGILHAAGMVSRTKQGNHTLYAISDPSVFELCDQVCGGLRRQVAELDAILQAPPAAAGRA